MVLGLILALRVAHGELVLVVDGTRILVVPNAQSDGLGKLDLASLTGDLNEEDRDRQP